MKASAFFAQSYAEARSKFIDAATAAGQEPVAHPHPLLGRDGELLAMDVARFGPADAPALLRALRDDLPGNVRLVDDESASAPDDGDEEAEPAEVADDDRHRSRWQSGEEHSRPRAGRAVGRYCRACPELRAVQGRA